MSRKYGVGKVRQKSAFSRKYAPPGRYDNSSPPSAVPNGDIMNDLLNFLSVFGSAARPILIRVIDFAFRRRPKKYPAAAEHVPASASSNERSELLDEIRRATSILEFERRDRRRTPGVHPNES
jgi:hypothetical protein